MDARRGREVVRDGRQHRAEPDRLDPLPDDLSPARQFEGGDDLAGVQLDVAAVADMQRRIDRLHQAAAAASSKAASVASQARRIEAWRFL